MHRCFDVGSGIYESLGSRKNLKHDRAVGIKYGLSDLPSHNYCGQIEQQHTALFVYQ